MDLAERFGLIRSPTTLCGGGVFSMLKSVSGSMALGRPLAIDLAEASNSPEPAIVAHLFKLYAEKTK